MVRLAVTAGLAALGLVSVSYAQSTHSYDALIATHAAANGVPEALVRRVILRESRYQSSLVGRGGTLGLMQIKLATARGLGYSGTADGLLDPSTNLTYAVKYLAGAYRTAGGNADRAVGYYASGYYYAAKRQRLSARVAKTSPQPQNGGEEPSATTPIAVRSTRTTPAAQRVGVR
jgi:soluble lytic murein transglycosylase-like protein